MHPPPAGTVAVRPVFSAADRFELGHVQQPEGAQDHRLIDLIERVAGAEQQVARVFKLGVGIRVAEARALLLRQVQREDQAARIDPTVHDLGQSP